MYEYAPAGYVGLLTILSDVARKNGYALGLHGTLSRDMDVIAVPWNEWSTHPEALTKALAKAIAIDEVAIHGPELKPHGRLAYTLALGMGARIDLSITPLLYLSTEKGGPIEHD